MGRRLAPQAEIARSRDQRTAEMVHPDPVDESTGRQRVLAAGDGPRQLQPAAAVLKGFRSAPARTARNRRGAGSPRLLGLPRRKTRDSIGVGVSSTLKALAVLPARWSATFARHYAALAAWLAKGGRARGPGRRR